MMVYCCCVFPFLYTRYLVQSLTPCSRCWGVFFFFRALPLPDATAPLVGLMLIQCLPLPYQCHAPRWNGTAEVFTIRCRARNGYDGVDDVFTIRSELMSCSVLGL